MWNIYVVAVNEQAKSPSHRTKSFVYTTSQYGQYPVRLSRIRLLLAVSIPPSRASQRPKHCPQFARANRTPSAAGSSLRPIAKAEASSYKYR